MTVRVTVTDTEQPVESIGDPEESEKMTIQSREGPRIGNILTGKRSPPKGAGCLTAQMRRGRWFSQGLILTLATSLQNIKP